MCHCPGNNIPGRKDNLYCGHCVDAMLDQQKKEVNLGLDRVIIRLDCINGSNMIDAAIIADIKTFLGELKCL